MEMTHIFGTFWMGMKSSPHLLPSVSDHRYIYLHQAEFSTKLLRWLEGHVETLTARLLSEGF